MLKDDKGRSWVGKRQEAAEKTPSQHFTADWLKERNTEASSSKFPQPIFVLPRSTFSSQVAGAKKFSNYSHSAQKVFPLWMHITDDLYTYSAFWDARQNLPMGPMVRILGILRYQKELLLDIAKYRWSGEIKNDALNYSCFLWYTGQDTEKGQLNAFIYEEVLKVFVGTYFFCSPKRSASNSSSLRLGENRVPYAVSLVPHGASNASHKLIYLTLSRKTELDTMNHTGVCVRPLFGPYTDLAAITLFISYYSTVLSISHFYFYDFAISEKVKELLMILMADGEVSIHLLPWNIPFADWESLWDLGSLTSINDCIYRTSGKHNYVAIVDLDEFIVPRAPITNLGQLYTSVIKHKHGKMGDSVLILNAFFCSEFQKKNGTNKSNDFSVFTDTFREARLWPPKTRSKIVVVPEAVVAVGHHMVHHFLKPTSKNQASPKLFAVLHHYRNCDGLRMGIYATGSLVLNQKPIQDSAVLKYKKDVLASRTMRQYLLFIKDT
uniref:Glycosyltransferase family 92 protein n=1 Tax=Scylla olivacea TaxID=85551 RepID=A0A0P4WGF8_SCYOL